jgi:hypothetical protein
MATAALFDRSNIDALACPPRVGPERHLIRALVTQGSTRFIDNAETEVRVLQFGDAMLPITINTKEYANSFVCSPYGSLVLYALEELAVLDSRLLRALLGRTIRTIGALLRACQANRVVILNNWLVSTNPYAAWKGEQLAGILQFLARRFPRHYLLLRSVNALEHGPLCADLRALGCHMIPARQVYHVDIAGTQWRRRPNMRRDIALLERTAWTRLAHEDFRESDYAQCARLYHALYIEKYSRQNPRFTPDFMRLCHGKRVFDFIGLRDEEGTVQAFAALHVTGGMMSIPFIGYATQAGRAAGLYRVRMARVMLDAARRVRVINCGAGVGAFKRSRGAVPHTEYMAVYDRHLSRIRRLPYRLVAYLMEHIGVRIMLSYGL